jgi:hypothetical protein
MTFQSDGFQELIGSLDEFAQHLKKAQSCSYHWRWAIEALHSALQNAMVLALAGTWDVRTLKPHHAKKLIAKQHIEFDANLRATAQLDSFPGLYGKIQDPEMMGQYTHSRRLEPSPSMDEAVSWLNVTRYELKHFRVQTVLFDAAIWPKFCIECLAVIRFLVHDSNNIFWFRRSTQIRAARALVAAENATERIRGVYESEI